jgi:hypothetical protein
MPRWPDREVVNTAASPISMSRSSSRRCGSRRPCRPRAFPHHHGAGSGVVAVRGAASRIGRHLHADRHRRRPARDRSPSPPYIWPHAALGPSLVHGAVRVERPPLGPCAATRGQSSTLTRQIPVQAVVRVNTAAALTAKDMSSTRFSTSGPFPPPSRCRLRRRGRSRRTIRGMGGADEQPIPDYFVIG